jgi:predicted ATP-dependent endonuclease of OLD family
MNALSWRAVVLVEGVSDQRALDTRAARRGRDLSAEGVSIVPIGGAQRSDTSWSDSALED